MTALRSRSCAHQTVCAPSSTSTRPSAPTPTLGTLRSASTNTAAITARNGSTDSA
ncbi:hypothetical protein Q0F99_08365 [Rathayibacter oskolensis]|uniref:hypothetical protein n=1 Tax=Rathayibacter oskolensis TaxID=1891671 RepID=UPI00265DA988|nr:hypothetical protein [Rathayibacter oskolensis]WKK72872.1 hypothetical protein Q0F99_08365 [Rathayibacter oskolensis]